jgi:hypothetical protein
VSTLANSVCRGAVTSWNLSFGYGQRPLIHRLQQCRGRKAPGLQSAAGMRARDQAAQGKQGSESHRRSGDIASSSKKVGEPTVIRTRKAISQAGKVVEMRCTRLYTYSPTSFGG